MLKVIHVHTIARQAIARTGREGYLEQKLSLQEVYLSLKCLRFLLLQKVQPSHDFALSIYQTS